MACAVVAHYGTTALPGKCAGRYARAMASTPAPGRAKPVIAAVVVAAGRGVRAGGGLAKQYRMLGGKPVLLWSVDSLLAHPAIDCVQLVVAADALAAASALVADRPVAITIGGATRQQSVHRGLQALRGRQPTHVLIHDAARPIVPAALVDRVCAALDGAVAVCPALPVADSLRRGAGGVLTGEVARDDLWRVQTPQGFDYAAILAAHAAAAAGATDDCEIARHAGHAVRLVAGDPRTLKITHAEDFAMAEQLLGRISVTGSGYDVHRFGAGDHVWLCGVRVPSAHGLIGHSDADVGLHALTDAILGALGDGDIGTHFPPSDPKWKGASSDRFLRHAAALATAAGARIVHCDLTLICEQPRIGPWRDAMLARLAELLAPHRPLLSVKATTTEGLGFVGRGEGAAAQALATLEIVSKEVG